MCKLPVVPKGLDQINEIYGNPDIDGDLQLDGEWFRREIQIFSLPYPLRLSWDPDRLTSTFQAHRDVAPIIIDALVEIGDFKGGSFLERNRFNHFGGAFNFRASKGSGRLSTHSWGIALDLNPHLGPWTSDPALCIQPTFIVDAFKKRGFEWGGDWPETYDYPFSDGMHFQAAVGY